MTYRLAVGCIQLDGRDASTRERIGEAHNGIRRACETAHSTDAGDVLVVLPELWPLGFFHFDDYLAAAERLDGEVVSALSDAAREAGAWVLGGSLLEQRVDGVHNTTVLLSPDGGLAATYRKIHLFGYQSAEASLLTAGTEAVCADTPWGRCGLMTCYDIRFPELSRDLVDNGAEHLLVVSAWPAPRIEHWRTLLLARAIENQAWVIATNAAGTDAGVRLGGHSMVVAPDGDVVAEAGEDEETLSTVIEPSAVTTTRTGLPFLADRRYELRLRASH